ncbi:hypothetical protein MS3_00006787 [Schistosoma haematobium]|uniref:PRORP domain-containing protein n=1 Tax=Schistosoma haematobium TaxID=6185 RepID=A0A922LIB6_SCHHA|nr:hypothetical protein MS3_00006787 [Schistosoma haematobium]KAH9585577.1 hypothetical protein MS3_00006787 [Schistosoma haematobium]CAH8526041.1 unnamed protein product [Schistosoma haematobium]
MSAYRMYRLLYQKFHFYNYCIYNIQGRFFSKSNYKITTLFENATKQDISRSYINSVLSPLGDFTVSVSDCRDMNNNLPSTHLSFWPCLLNYASYHDCPELRRSLTNYILSDINEHSNATLMCTLKLLGIQERYTEFKSLYDYFLLRLNAVEKKVFQNDIAKSVARTPFWRDTPELLFSSETKKCDNSAIYEQMCSSALKFDTISSFFECMHKLSGSPRENVFYEFFNKLNGLEEEESVRLVSQLFQIMQTHRWIITYEIAECIQRWFANLKHERWSGVLSAFVNRGYLCSVCRKSLPPPDMSQFHFPQMADAFYETVIKGTDIESLYLTATSNEVMTLKRFVDSQSEPLDCIIDFMNLMNMRKFLSSDSSGLQVAEVLRQINKDFNLRRFCFVSKGNTIIRKSEFWNPIKMLGNQLGISVQKFCTNSSSEDDVFLLYMAMKSGPQCYIVSNDEFKQYRFSSGPELGEQISRWQSLRQLVLQPRGRIYQKPSKCDLCVHGNLETGWHIPYYKGHHQKFHTAVDSWLCLHRLK